MKVTAFLRVTLSIVVTVVARFDLARCIPVSELDSYQSSPLLLPASSKTSGAPPPLIFPNGNSDVYKIVENDTALKILQARAEAELTDESNSQHAETTEGQNVQPQRTLAVAAVEGAGDSAAINGNNSTDVPQSDPTPNTSSPPSSSSDNYDADNDNDANGNNGGDADGDDDDDYSSEEDDDDDDDDDDVDTEVVNVQPEDPDKEDGLEEQFRNKDRHYPLVIDNTMIEVSAMRQEHVWVIVTGAIFVLTLTAYIAMVLYRNRLERRYGMRQRLVTEDDYYTNNDI
ncbi:lateral signaling target protein 2 homolog [Sabethes cyaneus]|uniref:lateral signaling target protein 2 homolog n=1 Tax=Sabethes cyaneus TaxID=53552 RepID=UPI00237D595D|nr:lateral signaling target protein 2 homolog [Sabethes cyaneus]